MKKQKKKIFITLLVVILITSICDVAFAEYHGMANSVIVPDESKIGSWAITERMLGAAQVIGSVISVVALIIIGIRYMVGSVEEKASLKGILGYYVVGAVLVFATVNIVALTYNIIEGLGGESGSPSSSSSTTKPNSGSSSSGTTKPNSESNGPGGGRPRFKWRVST